MDEEPLICCDRCKSPGGTAYRGWQLLCKSCANEDDMEWFEDKLDPWTR